MIGGLEMVAGYFLYEQFVLGYAFAAALAEVPLNISQMLVGLIVASPNHACCFACFPTA